MRVRNKSLGGKISTKGRIRKAAAHSPLKVGLCAVAGARRHRHRVRLAHNAPGGRLQLPVDSLYSHEARLPLQARIQMKAGRDPQSWLLLCANEGCVKNELPLATINNSHSATACASPMCARVYVPRIPCRVAKNSGCAAKSHGCPPSALPF